MAHGTLLFRVRPHHETGGVAQGHHGQPERFAQLHEARRLVAAHRIDGAAQVLGIVGDQAERLAFNAHQGGDHAGGKRPAQFQHRTGIGQCLDDPAHVIDAGAFFRNAVPQLPRVRRLPVRHRALEIGQVLFGHGHRLGFIADSHIHYPVGRLHTDRPHLFRRKAPQTTAFDHGRPGHTNGGIFCGDDHIAATQQGGVTGKAATRTDAHQWHLAGQFRHGSKGMAIQPRHADKIRIPRTTAAPFRKQHQRHLPLAGQLQQAIGLLVVHHSLGTSEHGVVVAHGHHPRALLAHLIRVDRAGTTNQSVRRAHGLQFLGTATAALGGQGHGAIFLEAARVEQIVEVFPGSALALAVAFCHRLGPAFVADGLVAIQHLRQVLADMVQVHAFFRGDVTARHLTGFHKQQRRGFVQGIALPGGQAVHAASRAGAHFEFHLHGLQHRHHLTHLHGISFLDKQGHQHPGGGAQQRLAAGGGRRRFTLRDAGHGRTIPCRHRRYGRQQGVEMAFHISGGDRVGCHVLTGQQCL